MFLIVLYINYCKPKSVNLFGKVAASAFLADEAELL